MSHDDAGQAADGAPQSETSSESVADVIDAGTFARFQNQMLRGGHQPARTRARGGATHKMPETSNCVAHTPPPLSANA